MSLYYIAVGLSSIGLNFMAIAYELNIVSDMSGVLEVVPKYLPDTPEKHLRILKSNTNVPSQLLSPPGYIGYGVVADCNDPDSYACIMGEMMISTDLDYFKQVVERIPRAFSEENIKKTIIKTGAYSEATEKGRIS